MIEPTLEVKICSDCGREYQAQVYVLMGTKLVFGQGRCPECNSKRWAEAEAKEQKQLEAWLQSTREQWRSRCGIPLKFQDTRFSTYDKTYNPKLNHIYKLCWDYAEKFPLELPRGYKSLLLFSQESWGVAKTHLACSIAHHIIDRWQGEDICCPVKFVSEPDLYTRIQSTYRDNSPSRENEADIIKELVAVRLLIIDDVGKRSVVDPKFVHRIMFSIIDGRYKVMLPIILTANLHPDDLAVYLGGARRDAASIDRLSEMCEGKWYQMEGRSYRSGV